MNYIKRFTITIFLTIFIGTTIIIVIANERQNKTTTPSPPILFSKGN